MSDQIDDPWNMIEEKEYAAFKEEKKNILNLTFLENNFTSRKNPQYGNLQYDFQVMEVEEPGLIKTFSPSSNRLMNKLKAEVPLEGKTFRIERFGKAFDTDYTIEKIELTTDQKKTVDETKAQPKDEKT